MDDNVKKAYNETRVRNIKRAKIKQKEAELEYYMKHGYSNKEIIMLQRDINNLRKEL